MIPKRIDTLAIDGEDLRVLPVSLDVSPFKARSTTSGQFGDVHIEWPGMRASAGVNVQYSKLSDEDADALALMCTVKAGLSKTVRFSFERGEPIYATRYVKLDLSATAYGWDASVQFTGVVVPV